jgi:hypothetical protein
MPQFMVIVKGDDPEGHASPDAEALARMGTYNEMLADNGVMVDGNGLLPSNLAHRIDFAAGGESTVVDGPFAEAKELIAGYWIFECASLEEAVDWARKAPFEDGAQLEVRKVASAEDFGDAYTEEVREQEDRVRAKVGSHEAAERINS